MNSLVGEVPQEVYQELASMMDAHLEDRCHEIVDSFKVEGSLAQIWGEWAYFGIHRTVYQEGQRMSLDTKPIWADSIFDLLVTSRYEGNSLVVIPSAPHAVSTAEGMHRAEGYLETISTPEWRRWAIGHLRNSRVDAIKATVWTPLYEANRDPSLDYMTIATLLKAQALFEIQGEPQYITKRGKSKVYRDPNPKYAALSEQIEAANKFFERIIARPYAAYEVKKKFATTLTQLEKEMIGKKIVDDGLGASIRDNPDYIKAKYPTHTSLIKYFSRGIDLALTRLEERVDSSVHTDHQYDVDRVVEEVTSDASYLNLLLMGRNAERLRNWTVSEAPAQTLRQEFEYAIADGLLHNKDRWRHYHTVQRDDIVKAHRQPLLEESGWEILPSEAKEIIEKCETTRKDDEVEIGGKRYFPERLKWVAEIALMGAGRVAVTDLKNSKHDQYYAAVIEHTTDAGEVVESVIADDPVKNNGIYVFRGDIGLELFDDPKAWRTIFAEGRESARALGAKRVNHTDGSEKDRALDYLTKPRAKIKIK